MCANVDGFDLHGRIAFGAAQRERVEELLRYCALPPLANDRLENVATILDPRVARRILEHMGVSARAPPELPPRDPSPFWPSGADGCD